MPSGDILAGRGRLSTHPAPGGPERTRMLMLHFFQLEEFLSRSSTQRFRGLKNSLDASNGSLDVTQKSVNLVEEVFKLLPSKAKVGVMFHGPAGVSFVLSHAFIENYLKRAIHQNPVVRMGQFSPAGMGRRG